MPNHCSNNLSCTSGKNIGEIIKPYLTKGDIAEGYFIDFNKIIPMPEGIKKLNDMSTHEEIVKDRTPEEKAERDTLMESIRAQNKKETGHESWYEWCVATWDTKWNSYSNWSLEDAIIEEGDGGYNKLEDLSNLGFQTAWSPPINIIRELSKLTGESLRLTYFDEGWMFGGEYLVNADGSEQDNCYEDIHDVPDHLREELDVDSYLEMMEDDEEE